MTSLVLRSARVVSTRAHLSRFSAWTDMTTFSPSLVRRAYTESAFGYKITPVISRTVGMIGRSYGSNAPPPDIEETEFNPAIANNISIIGNVGRKPEMKYLESGSKVTNFPVAFTDRRDGDTQWFDVEAWDELADIANLYVDKGERVALQGRLKVQDWTDREGNTRKSLRIVAQQIKKVKRNSMYGTNQMDAQRQVFSGQDEQQQPRQAMVRNTSAVQQEQSPMTFEELWMNFFENTSGWYDNRERKANGEINPKSPDFKRIEGGRDAPALWIESKTTPAWVKAELSKLDRLQNDIPPF